MVLAAGLGKRMRPLTATRPKPLVEVAGRTLLDWSLGTLRAGGVKRAVVNVHYMADRMEAHLRARDAGLEIAISDERACLLETGGGIAKALPLLDTETFLAINADNIWLDGPTPAVRLLTDAWDPDMMDALLLCVPLAQTRCHAGRGDFHMDAAGRLARRRANRIAPFTYMGLQMVSRHLFDGVAVEPFSMNRLWETAIARGRLFGVQHPGPWFDVGTPAAIPHVEAALRARGEAALGTR
jgi:MurNAc alpha-1-phosphate uridylyltransferase